MNRNPETLKLEKNKMKINLPLSMMYMLIKLEVEDHISTYPGSDPKTFFSAPSAIIPLQLKLKLY